MSLGRNSYGGLVPTFPEYHFNVTVGDRIDPPAVIYVTTAGAYSIQDVGGNIVEWTLAAGACAPVMATKVVAAVDTSGIIGVRQFPTPFTG